MKTINYQNKMGNFYDLINTKKILDILHPNYIEYVNHEINVNDIEYIVYILTIEKFVFKEKFITALLYKNETRLVKIILSNDYYQNNIKDIYFHICAINNNFELLEFMCDINNKNMLE